VPQSNLHQTRHHGDAGDTNPTPVRTTLRPSATSGTFVPLPGKQGLRMPIAEAVETFASLTEPPTLATNVAALRDKTIDRRAICPRPDP